MPVGIIMISFRLEGGPDSTARNLVITDDNESSTWVLTDYTMPITDVGRRGAKNNGRRRLELTQSLYVL